METASNHERAAAELESWFAGQPGVVAAFSGGVDSALVLFMARRALGRQRAIGCLSDSPSLKRSDLSEAKAFCRHFDIELEIIHTRELEDEAYHTNPINRCYACKSHLYHDLDQLLPRYPGFRAINGTNRDDLGDYRPGLLAASQRSVLSPLAECGFGKAQVRALARHFGLPVWDKPASPCLSSRIPYGSPVTREKLRQIEAAEAALAERGFATARVRHFGGEARIEVPSEQIEALRANAMDLQPIFAALGFTTATIDPEGLVSGKLNRSIARVRNV